MLEFSSTPILLSPFSIKSIIWESSHLGYLNLLLCMVSKPRTISIRGDTLLACYAEFKKAKGRTTNAFCDQLKNSAPKVGAPNPTPVTVTMSSFAKAFAGVMKLRLLRWGDQPTKCHHMSPYKGEGEARVVCTQGKAKWSQKILVLNMGMMWPWVKECQWPPEAEMGMDQILPETPGGSTVLLPPCF